MNATEATSTEEDNRQRGKGNAGRCSKQASKRIYSKIGDIMEKLVAVVHPKSSQNLLYLSEKWKQFGNIMLVIYKVVGIALIT